MPEIPTPLPPWVGAATSILDPVAQMVTNIGNRRFTEKMYNRQRQDALSDWQMQNEYNSPKAQMQRYSEAGLNPNLIYGQMSNSPTVRSSDYKQYNAQAPQFGNVTGKFMDLKIQNQQLDNLVKQNELIQAQANKTNVEARSKEWQLDYNQEVRGYRVQSESIKPQVLNVSVQEAMNRLGLQGQQFQVNELNMKKLIAETARIVAEKNRINLDTVRLNSTIRAINLDNILRETEIKMRQSGASFKDGIIQRNIAPVVKKVIQMTGGSKVEEFKHSFFPYAK